jgi:hypothetical protein
MKNIVLLVEPRAIIFCKTLLDHYISILGKENWHYIFYFGKDTKELWNSIDPVVEMRELPVSNFENSNKYNDFIKQKSLWESLSGGESLSGRYILTIQLDTWIFEDSVSKIYDFIKLDKSFIGGNMQGYWIELKRENYTFNNYNFNGGLSLRKLDHMIEVCNRFPPEPTIWPSNKIETDGEDVYFTFGCHKLGFPIGDDEITSNFALHRIFKNDFFGIHQASLEIKNNILEKYPNLDIINPYLFQK